MFNGQYVQRWLDERNLSQAWLARRLNIPRQHVNQWIKGNVEPKANALAAIAAVLGVPMRQLWLDENSQVHEDQAIYNVGIPVVGMVGAAGLDVPLYTDGDYPAGVGLDTVHVPLNDPEVFALMVRGDSMQPIYLDGTIVVINPRLGFVRGGSEIRPILNGRVYYVRDSNERRYIKVVRRLNGTYILSSANEAYDPIVLQASAVIDLFGIVMTIQPSH